MNGIEFGFLLKGFIIGFAIAAPVGPIGVLCIRRTLADGRLTGFVSGLGAATADLSYGAVAAFSLTFIQDGLVRWQFWLHLLGGFFLLFLVRSSPALLRKLRPFDQIAGYSRLIFLHLA